MDTFSNFFYEGFAYSTKDSGKIYEMLQLLCKIFEIINTKLIVCKILNHCRFQVDEHTSAHGGYFLFCHVLIGY